MLETARAHGFRFDTVQMPLNVLDAHHDSFEKRVLPVALREEMGVIGMKPLADHAIVEEKVATPVEALRYAMSLPVSVVVTGIDSMRVLQQDLGAARGFQPMSQADVRALLARTAGAARGGRLERYKTSRRFDGTARHPEWLG